MFTTEIFATLVDSVGSIGSGTFGLVDAFQAMNQKPDIWDTLTGIFDKLADVLASFGGVIAELMKIIGT